MHSPEKPPGDGRPSQQAPSDSEYAATEPTAIATLADDDVLSDAEAARLIRKIDWHVLPMLFLIYVVAFLDRYVAPLSQREMLSTTTTAVQVAVR